MERLTTSEIVKNTSSLGPPIPHNIACISSAFNSRMIRRAMEAERRRERRRLAKAQNKNKFKAQ